MILNMSETWQQMWRLTQRYVSLTESTYRHQASIDDETVSMEILDTAGQVQLNTNIHIINSYDYIQSYGFNLCAKLEYRIKHFY